MNTAALIIHPDSGWRRRLSEALGPRGVGCRTMASWGPGAGGAAPPDPRVVVLFMDQEGWGDAGPRFNELRAALNNPPIIAVTKACDAAATRAAFRCGAVDCIEQSAATSRLVEGVVCAMRNGDGAGPVPVGGEAGGPMVLDHCVFLDRLARSRDECRRRAAPMSILMLDLDRFRECNETHSPAFGDFVLSWFARTLSMVFAGRELVARYHGDRFIVALPGVGRVEAARAADECRECIQRRPPVWQGEPYEIGVSIGLSESSAAFLETEHMLIRRARLALEDAKRRGANQTRSWAQVAAGTGTLPLVGPSAFDQIGHLVARTREQVRTAYNESTHALVAAAEAKESFAARHSHKVSCHAEAIARRMGLRPQMVNLIRKAAILHDVGKIGVPDAILTKPGALTASEFEVIKRHPMTGVEILRHISHLDDELPSIRHHHERYDGTGYPDGLAGTDIPIGARVIAVADAIDVMLTSRSYKEPYSIDTVREELRLGAGRQFDPHVVATALAWIDDPRSVTAPDEAGTWRSRLDYRTFQG